MPKRTCFRPAFFYNNTATQYNNNNGEFFFQSSLKVFLHLIVGCEVEHWKHINVLQIVIEIMTAYQLWWKMAIYNRIKSTIYVVLACVNRRWLYFPFYNKKKFPWILPKLRFCWRYIFYHLPYMNYTLLIIVLKCIYNIFVVFNFIC